MAAPARAECSVRLVMDLLEGSQAETPAPRSVQEDHGLTRHAAFVVASVQPAQGTLRDYDVRIELGPRARRDGVTNILLLPRRWAPDRAQLYDLIVVALQIAA